jgi:hypothetical protein
MRAFVLILASALFVLCGCGHATQKITERGAQTASAAPEPILDPQLSALRRELHNISIADGISNAEADLIARCYFARNVGCGGYERVADGGGNWLVKGAYGFTGKDIVGFKINKSSGQITSPIGPSYSTPLDILP